MIQDPVTIKFYLDNLEKLTNLSQKELRLSLQLQQKYIVQNTTYVNKPKNKFKSISLQEKLLEVQKQLFFLLLLDRSVYLFLEQEKFIFANKELMNLYFLISQQYQENDKLTKIDFDEILNLLKDNEIFNFLQAIINQYKDKNYEVKQSILQDYLKIIKKCLIESEIASLNQQLIKSDDLDNKLKLLKEMSVLKNKLND